MRKPNADKEYREIDEWIPRIYTNSELEDFDRKYKKHNFKEYSDFLKYVGALNSEGAVYINVKKVGTVAYNYWNNLLRQWQEYCGKKEYAIKQTAMNIPELADATGCF
jgi:hypothetical protein